ncbi:copper chaperone PCu(A)C [Castellaniella sp.]|uniref:copper chaperone PCu(A)C n=1 Tax=Castellaniella sp. TaxID=1955812 RepID=UPI003569414A
MKIKLTHIATTLGLALALMQPGAIAWAHGNDHSHGSDHGHAHGAAAQGPDYATLASRPIAGQVTADGCWIRQMPKPTPSGGFLVIHNQGSEPVRVQSAASPDYEEIMLHQTTHEGGVSKMAMIDELAIPAGQQVELKPGSYHLMLEGPREGLALGDEAQVLLALSNGTTVLARCAVMSPKTARKP